MSEQNTAASAPGLLPLYLLIGLCVGVELCLMLGDLGVIDIPRFRGVMYENLQFWPRLLGNWQPNYAAQPYAMFITYGFLHVGFWHLTFNMITLYALGRLVVERIGVWKFLFLYFAGQFAGAAAHAALTSSYHPIAGASGALFGLAGALLAWDYVDRFATRERLWPVLRGVVFLVALNAIMYVAMKGQLAWQAHLGGFVAGWIMATLLDPRGRDWNAEET